MLLCKGKEYKVHGVLLAAASPFFESVLQKIPDDRQRHITLPDVELSTIETLLHIVYTGKLPSPLSSVKNLLTVISQLKGFGVYFKEFDDCVNELEVLVIFLHIPFLLEYSFFLYNFNFIFS